MNNKILFSKYRDKTDLKGIKVRKPLNTLVKLKTETAENKKSKSKLTLSAAKSLKLLRYTGIASAVAGLIYLVWLGVEKVNFSQDFEIKEVMVSGNKYISKNELLSIAKVETRTNMFKVSLKEAQARLKANSQLKSVSVTRVFPATVEIKVVERDPVAYIGENRAFQIDREGVVFPAIKSFFHGKRLYTITGVQSGFNESGKKITSPVLKQALAMIDKLTERSLPYLNDVMVIDITCPEEMALVVPGVAQGLSPGSIKKQFYKLGDGNWDEKFDKLACLLKNVADKKKDIACVDLRFRDEAVVQYR